MKAPIRTFFPPSNVFGGWGSYIVPKDTDFRQYFQTDRGDPVVGQYGPFPYPILLQFGKNDKPIIRVRAWRKPNELWP